MKLFLYDNHPAQQDRPTLMLTLQTLRYFSEDIAIFPVRDEQSNETIHS